MHSTSVGGAVLLASLFEAADAADATVTATATMSSFRIDLFDLDPSDGVAPSMTFNEAVAGGFIIEGGTMPA